MKILIIIALYLLVFFEIWDRTVNVRKKFWYVFKKLFRPIIIYIGGLDERNRAERNTRKNQFRDSSNTERNRLDKGNEQKDRTTKNLRRETEKPSKGSSNCLEIIKAGQR